MRFVERVAAFRDRAPRRTALLIVGLLVGMLCLDASRLLASREELAGTDWSRDVLWGVIAGAAMLSIGGLAWLAARRFPSVRVPTEVVAAVVVVLLFAFAHPRYGDDTVSEQGTLMLLIAVDVLFCGILAYAVIRSWTREPIVCAS